eukprot:4555586-Ditylum_brightwellii.AAC.1
MFGVHLSLEWSISQDDHLWAKRLWTRRSKQINKFLWDQFIELWHSRNSLVCGKNEYEKTQLKIERFKVVIKTIFHFKSKLIVADRQYMFQSQEEISEFLNIQSLLYIQGWITVRFFKQGIKEGQTKAIKEIKLMMSYFRKKTLGIFSR